MKDRLLALFYLLGSLWISYLLWFWMGKGFDLSDEGFLMLNYSHPAEPNVFLYYTRILHDLLPSSFHGIYAYRLLRFWGSILASYYFSKSLLIWLKPQLKEKLGSVLKSSLHAYVLVGTLMSYSIFSTALSYNSLTLILGLLMLGAMLRAVKALLLSEPLAFGRHLFFIGLICGFEFFVKFHTSILFSLTALAWLIAHCIYHRKLKGLIRTLLFFSLGLIIPFAYVFVSIKAPAPYYHELREALASIGGHGIGDLKILYISSLSESLEKSIEQFWFIPIVALMALVFYRFFARGKWHRTKDVMMAILLAFVLYPYWKYMQAQHLYESGMRYEYRAIEPFLILGAILFLSYFIASLRKLGNSGFLFERVMLFALLLLAPGICALGTGNRIMLQCLQYLAFPLALVPVCYIIYKNYLPRFSASVIAALIFLLCLSQIRSGYFLHPYRLNHPLPEQVYSLPAAAKKEKIQVDKETYDFIKALSLQVPQAAAKGDSACFVDLCRVPGAVYLMHGRTPGNGWLSPEYPKANCYFLQHSHADYTHCVLLLPSNFIADQQLQDGLRAKGIVLGVNWKKRASIPHYLFGYNAAPNEYQVDVWTNAADSISLW